MKGDTEVLPQGWDTVALGQVCDLINGDRGKNYPGHKALSKEGIPFVNAGDLQDGQISNERLGCVASSTFDLLRSGKFGIGDILYCIRGSLGKVALNTRLPIGGIASSLIIVRANFRISQKYIYYYLSSPLAHRMIQRFDNGTAQPNLAGADLAKFQVPLPGPRTQERIVAKIEELLSELDKGFEALISGRRQLTAYRQSLLKHAFEGKLTEDWRNANASLLSTPEVLEAGLRAKQALLQRTDLEAWERSISVWSANGERGRKPSRPEPCGPATLLDRGRVCKLPELPKGWAYFPVASLCSVVRGGSPRPAGDPKFYGGTIPFLKVADLTRTPGKKVSTHTYTITEAGLSKTRQTPPDTLLISNSGATLGVPKICAFETTFNDGIAAFLGLFPEYIEYLYYFWESKTSELRGVDQGAAQPNLNTFILGEMPVPMCSTDEAIEIVHKLEDALSVSERLLFEIDDQLILADALRQSILKQAFSGQLVTQDPEDQPASVLLALIRDEREEAISERSRSQRSAKIRKKKGNNRAV